jgi:hypothetical protein
MRERESVGDEDVHAGTLAIRSGNPHDTEPWEWRCGFYPGSPPRRMPQRQRGAAWRMFLPNRTEADFQAWRDQRDWTERKYALWDAGKRLEPPSHGPIS